MYFIGIIPARYASTRFPGKPLADIAGKTMIERVYRQATQSIKEVYVATDDERIAAEVHRFGGNAVMTAATHRSGTDRCYEAYKNIGSKADIIINIQGDEPFIDPQQINKLKNCFIENNSTQIATLVRRFDPESGFEALFNPNTPKVVMDNNMNALYFSRSIIPYIRGVEWKQWLEQTTFFTHVGMYGYRADTLSELVNLPQSSLELAESLEQLRWMQAGYKIRIGITESKTIGIDTPEDLKAAIKFITENERTDK